MTHDPDADQWVGELAEVTQDISSWLLLSPLFELTWGELRQGVAKLVAVSGVLSLVEGWRVA